MTRHTICRDIASPVQRSRAATDGRAYIAVIGIDRYANCDRLYNAVSDANGALKLFGCLGFEVAGALFDENATGDAIRRLVVDDLSELGKNDSLVLFFAGHGHTVTRTYDGTSVKDGYLVPVNGDHPGGRTGTWIRLQSWLTDVTRLPARHILVILDACHSGLALGPILQWRSRGAVHARREPLEQLRERRSRRIITSALDDQLAMDSGPVLGHSLFTGCLIEAMSGGLASMGLRVVTGSEIAHYVQRRVSEYPGSTQTPDFGALELDARGELVVDIQQNSPDVGQHDANSATLEDASAEDTCLVADAMPQSTSTICAIQHSNQPKLIQSTQRRSPSLTIGGGLAMLIACSVVALLAKRGNPTVEAASSTFGDSKDASTLIAPPDAAPAVVVLDAAQPDAISIEAEAKPSSIQNNKSRQYPIRRTEDAAPEGPDRPPIDDRGN